LQIVFYVSGHGFGHASRDIELMRALLARRPDARLSVRAAIAAPWFAAAVAGLGIDLQQVEVDTGMVQVDSLRFDEDETARAAARFHAAFDDRAGREAAILRGLGADVVIADIPPLAFAAAARAGVPSVAVANFTWDWIYGSYPAFDRLAADVLPAIRRAYAQATLALRLPLHGGFQPMAAVTRDIPFIARRSARDPLETRRALGITSGRPVVLPSFGAYGVDLPIDRVAREGRVDLIDATRALPNGLLYQDLVAAADVVVSKPGYGIVSECAANGTALLYTSRGRFAEYDVFVAEMPHVLRCRYVSQEDLLAGRWSEAVEALLQQPAQAQAPRCDGADVAAQAVVNLAQSSMTR
jgi:UDP:flavonoid glycosyltransferase YjiC (YdhE family)